MRFGVGCEVFDRRRVEERPRTHRLHGTKTDAYAAPLVQQLDAVRAVDGLGEVLACVQRQIHLALPAWAGWGGGVSGGGGG